MSDFWIITIALAVLCVIMLLFGIMYALFALVGLLQRMYEPDEKGGSEQ